MPELPWGARPQRLLLRVVGALVPEERRAAWRREWEAELAAAAARGRSRLRLVRGIVADARAMREVGRVDRMSRRNTGRPAVGALDVRSSLKHAVRSLARAPGFTIASVATLALGLAATAAIFTLVDSILLRPLPYPSASRLVRVAHAMEGEGGVRENPLTHHTFLFIAEHSRTLDAAGAYRTGRHALTGDGEAERVQGARVTAGLLEVIGARTVTGRVFTAQEDRPGASDVVVLGHGLWMRRYGGDPGIVGRTITIDDSPREVIGVMAEDVQLPTTEVSLWVPEAIDPARSPSDEFRLQAIARMAAGHDLASVREELNRLTQRLPEVAPFFTIYLDQFGMSTSAEPLRDHVVGDVASTLWILLGSVGIVLLIALANVANLFLVRAEHRRQEVSVRSALGARPRHLLTDFLCESALVTISAALLALIVAAAGVRILIAMAPPSIPRLDELHVGGATVAFVAVLCGLVALVLGAYPYLRHGRTGQHALNPRGVRGAADRRQGRTGDVLVVAQVSLALMLLAGAALLLRSFQNLRAVDPGFRAKGVVVANLLLPPGTYRSEAATNAFNDRLRERLSGIPGVRRTSIGPSPLTLGGCSGLYQEGVELAPGTFPPCTGMTRIGAGYFETLRVPVVAGRTFTDAEVREGAPVAVVSESLARRLWPDGNPIGRGIRPAPRNGPPWYRIVGVVGDVHARGPDQPPSETVYLPLVLAHDPWGPLLVPTVLIETDPAATTAVAAALRAAVAAIDPDVPVTIEGTLSQALARTMVRTSFTLFLLGTAAFTALVLGLVGLYGVVAYRVGTRRAEFGIRMAVGALQKDVLAMVLGHSLRLVAIGSALGVIGAYFGTRLLDSLLHGVRPGEPWLLALSATALFASAFVATWVPARRATRVDPAATLRTD